MNEKMTAMAENFREQVARLQQQAHEREIAALETEANQLNAEANELWEQAAQADNDGDSDYAVDLVRLANQKNQELQSKLAYLPQQDPAMSETKQKWFIDHQHLRDPNYGSRHWANNSKYISEAEKNAVGFDNLTQLTYNYGRERLGYPDDSPELVSFMNEMVEPAGYQPQLTPDEVVRMTQESRYAKDFSGKDYNRINNKIHKQAK
jgi:hypothetical protein